MDSALQKRLEEIADEREQLLARMSDPDTKPDEYADIGRRLSDIEEPVAKFEAWRELETERAEAVELAKGVTDPAEREFYETTAEDARESLAKLESELMELMTPKDPRDSRNVVVEIRAGAGGDEAAIFAGDLHRMYERFAERRNWKSEILDLSDAPQGGYREIVFMVKGKGAYSWLKYESGVHRVQRVPATESQGRIHTSTATVAVLAESDDVGEIEIDPQDLRIDTYRSSGPGGQHVNTTDSAVRLTHLPTGLAVACQSERSQLQNKERAMRLLVGKLQDLADQEAREAAAAERKAQVGTGDRSEKIRTYNFPQNRITDHRVGVNVHGMAQRMDGDIDEILEALRAAGDAAAREEG